MAKVYHQLMRGIGLTGPHKFRGAPEMEYWTSKTVDQTDAFGDLRDKNLIPFRAMVYRSSGDLCIGVFTNSPNEDYKGADADLIVLNARLVKALEECRSALAGVLRPLDEEEQSQPIYHRCILAKHAADEALKQTS
jgi:hypothetical protein